MKEICKGVITDIVDEVVGATCVVAFTFGVIGIIWVPVYALSVIAPDFFMSIQF